MVHGLFLQILRDGRELLHCRFQISRDVGGDDFGGGQVGGFFQSFVLQPEDVQVHLVALGQLVVGEGLEALALFAAVPVLRIVAGYKIIQITPLERIFLEREMQVGAQVVNPELLCPRFFLCGLTVEEQDCR